MKIRLLSDLHQEFYHDQLLYEPLGEDVLVIAGDLTSAPFDVAIALKRFAEKVGHVVYVTGNHEYYNRTIEEVDTYIKRETRNSNIHFLNPGSVKIGDVTFIGGCLWSNFNEDFQSKIVCSVSINDFVVIKQFSTDKCAELYYKHSSFIKEAYSKCPGKKIIVTHFLPDTACISAQYRGPDPLNNYFANNLGSWIADTHDVPYWFYGHSHDPSNLFIGDVNLIANPYGYNRNPKFKEVIVEV